MPKYLISFNDGDMRFPAADLPEVGRAAHEVVRQAIEAGVWIIGGGFQGFEASVVGIDGSITPGPIKESPVHMGGFSIINVESETEAFEWANKIAIACRCAQEVRRIMDDPEQDLMLKQNLSK